jgi:3-oxoadipate enol-lactonase
VPYVRTRLGRWFYEERGASHRPSDAAIVLWPSFLCDGGMFRHQIEPLSALGRVLVFDGPGHGRSEVPPPFTLEDNAGALIDALRDLRVERAIFVGLSWGGMLAMRVALQNPTYVRALALLDTSADAEKPARAVKYRLFVSLSRRVGMPPVLVDRQVVPLFFAGSTLRDRPEIVERFVRAANGFPREGLARAALAIVVHRKDIITKIDAIRAPTLVMCGREDRATAPEHSERIASRIPGARLVWVEGAGHLSALERPREVNDALVPFVQSQLGS